MVEIAHGLDIHFEGKINYVFFADGTCRKYDLGGMLFELISDEALYMMVDKTKNMIKLFPDFHKPLTMESLTDGFKWLYQTIEDEDLPVATEIFRSSFDEKIKKFAAEPGTYDCVGDFLNTCYDDFAEDMQEFCMYVDAVSEEASGIADEFYFERANEFKEVAKDASLVYGKKCSRRHKRDRVTLESYNFTTCMDILLLEYSRMEKEKKILKQCLWCGRIFIPKVRRDAKYCFAPAPDNPEKSCAEHAPQKTRSDKRKNNQLEIEHNRAYAQLSMAAKRARENGEEWGESHFIEERNKELKQYQEAKKAEEGQG